MDNQGMIDFIAGNLARHRELAPHLPTTLQGPLLQACIDVEYLLGEIKRLQEQAAKIESIRRDGMD